MSHALEIPDGLLAPDLREALRAVDSVHGDGELPRIPLIWLAVPDVGGIYRFEEATGSPTRIIVSRLGTRRRLATIHEIGHFLDHQALGAPGRFASGQDNGLMPWRDAVRASSAYERLKELEREHEVLYQGPGLPPGFPDDRLAVIRYLLNLNELWARSYAQYVAIGSGDPDLLRELADRRNRQSGSIYYHAQWEDDDFTPIGEEIDRLFRRLQWRE